jgi:1,2-diacylglycerol 3-alpha-glucosyltransferase
MFSNLYWPPVVSGSATQSAQLATRLASRGCNVLVITANLQSHTFEHTVEEGVDVYRLPAIRLPKSAISLNFPWLNYTFTYSNLRRIFQICERHRPDAFHLHNHMFDLAFSAAAASKRLRTPLFITVHTVIKHPQRHINSVLEFFDRRLLRKFVIERAQGIICPEMTIRDYVQSAFGKTTVEVVPYGIEALAAPREDVTRKILHTYRLDGRRVILSLGHLHEIRNRKDLIEAMPRVLKDVPNAVLVVVGAIGTQSAAIRVRHLGISNSVVFTGAVPHTEVPSFMQIADIDAQWFQKNNPQNRTLGIAALEAMSVGKTVIGTADENVYGEGVLKSWHNVVLVEPDRPNELAEVIVKLLRDSALRTEIGVRAAETIRRHFSWETVCSKLMKIYSSAVEVKAPPSRLISREVH